MLKHLFKEYRYNHIRYNLFVILTFIFYLTSISPVYTDGFFTMEILVVMIFYFSLLYYIFQIGIIKKFLKESDFNLESFIYKIIICTLIYVVNLIILYFIVNPHYHHFNAVEFQYIDGIDLLKYSTLIFFFGLLPLSLRLFYLLINHHPHFKKVRKHSYISLYLIIFYFVSYYLFYGIYNQVYHSNLRYLLIGYYGFVFFVIVYFICRVVKRLNVEGLYEKN